MKNLFIYYLAIILPIPVIVSFADQPMVFAALLASYYVLRGFTDSQRLLEKGIIANKNKWKVFIPFWRSRYFKELYFER